MSRVGRSFFDCDTIELAKKLLGKVLCRKVVWNGQARLLRGRIVETEAYPGGIDAASHSFNGRRTPGNEPMYMSPGTAYVYFTYGMYYCFNVSSGDEGGAILFRALEPLDGKDVMHDLRTSKKKTSTSIELQVNNSSKKQKLEDRDLCSGPAKLCLALDIRKDNVNMQDLAVSDDVWIEDDAVQCFETIATSPRVGIDSVTEKWRLMEYRFFFEDNQFVSRPPKQKGTVKRKVSKSPKDSRTNNREQPQSSPSANVPVRRSTRNRTRAKERLMS